MKHLLILGLLSLGEPLLAGPGLVFPFEYKDGLIWVNVESAGRSLHFVLDSGAESSVLNLETARRLGVKIGEPQTVQAVQARVVAHQAHGFVGQMGGFALKRDPLAMDLTGFSRFCSREIDGVIGQEFFHRRIVQIDYRSHCIRVLDKPVASSCPALPLKLLNDVMCVPVGVDGEKPRWTRLDTGCVDALHWIAGSSRFNGHKAPSLAVSHSNLDSSLTTVQLGTERIASVRTVFHRAAMFPGEAGLLGNAILSTYRVTIDGVSDRLLLEK